MTLKICLGPGEFIGEKNMILKEGVMKNPKTQLCGSLIDCDFIFLDYRDVNDTSFMNSISHLSHKIVIVDYRDQPEKIYPHNCHRYFKRSVVRKVPHKNPEFIKYSRDIIPISFCTKDFELKEVERDVDVSVFFPLNCHESYRSKISNFVQKNFKDLNIHVGIVGTPGKVGRNSIQKEYYDMLARTKIVVNMHPDNWEGDWRTWETLGSGSLLITEKMLLPRINPLVDRVHLVEYNRDNMEELEEKIKYFLKHSEERNKIASCGRKHAITFHKASNRIDEIIKELEV